MNTINKTMIQKLIIRKVKSLLLKQLQQIGQSLLIIT